MSITDLSGISVYGMEDAMSATRWGEQPSLLLDEVKEALDQFTALSSRMYFAARSIFVWHSIDLELQALTLAPPPP